MTRVRRNLNLALTGGSHLAALAVALWLARPIAQVTAQGSACSPGVRAVDDSPFGYRQRGDRCEGIYWQPHTGSAGEIVVLSLVLSPPPAVPVPDGPWPISWPGTVPGSDGRAQLHATSLRRGLFYRMDASAPLASGRYEWSTDVLRGLTLRADEISLRAETKVKIGSITWPALLPVGIGRASRASADFSVMLTSTLPLYAVTWECLRMTKAGMPGGAVAQGRREGPSRQTRRLPCRSRCGDSAASARSN